MFIWKIRRDRGCSQLEVLFNFSCSQLATTFNLVVVKSTLTPRSDFAALRELKGFNEKGAIILSLKLDLTC